MIFPLSEANFEFSDEITFFGDWILFLTTMNKCDFLMTQRPENKKTHPLRWENGEISYWNFDSSEFSLSQKMFWEHYWSFFITNHVGELSGFFTKNFLRFKLKLSIPIHMTHCDSRLSPLTQDRPLWLMTIHFINHFTWRSSLENDISK